MLIGEDISTTVKELAGNRIRVGEDSPVGWSLLGTRPRSENSFDLYSSGSRSAGEDESSGYAGSN